MTKTNFWGAILSLVVFGTTFLIWDTRLAFFNAAALIVVLFGTIATAFLAFPFQQLQKAFAVAKSCYQPSKFTTRSIISFLLEMAIRARRDGILALQKPAAKIPLSYMKNGFDVLIDGYDEREIRDILLAETVRFRQERQSCERIFRVLGKTAPAFGVAGSVIGLIGMLAGINDAAAIFQTIPMALVSTLYGLILSNLFLLPIAENIVSKTQEELSQQRIIIETLLSIKNEQNPMRLEKRLYAYLNKADRQIAYNNFQATKQRYINAIRAKKTPTTVVLPG